MTPLEADPLGTPSNRAEHEFNDHHGAVNESGWSHSNLWWPGQSPSGGTASNACPGDPAMPAYDNKLWLGLYGADGSSSGWAKYVRVGFATYLWGCLTDGPRRGTHWSASLPALHRIGYWHAPAGVLLFGNRWACDTEPPGSCHAS